MIVHTYKHWNVWTAIVAAKKTQKAIAAPLLGAYAYTEHDQPPKGPTIVSLRTREVRRPCHTEEFAKEQLTKPVTRSKPEFEWCHQLSSNTIQVCEEAVATIFTSDSDNGDFDLYTPLVSIIE